MASEDLACEEESRVIASAVAGDSRALEQLWQTHRPHLISVLISRGAKERDAIDVVDEVWGSMVPQSNKPSKLEKYNGRCSLKAWLSTVATHLWVDWMRRRKFFAEAPIRDPGQTDFLERAPQNNDEPPPETALITILCEALRAAFSACDDESFVMLRLVHMHDVSQRSIARMLGYHESKVSRKLDAAMNTIKKTAVQAVSQQDPWLTLTWQDFLTLCETQQIDFL